MSTVDPANVIHTRIWREESEPDNPYAAKAAFCHGYDVYGEMLGNAGWAEMLFLLFRGGAPSASQAALLDALAVAVANPGPREPSVHAAMCGGVGGSAAAASLMAALAVGAGQYGGARDVFDAITAWTTCNTDMAAWQAGMQTPPAGHIDIWPKREHPPGFDPHGVSTSTIVRQTLTKLAGIGDFPRLRWLHQHWPELTDAIGLPLALSGVAAAALADLGFSAQQGEMLHLLLRLPGAAAHALEQSEYGFRRFPLYPVELSDDPATAKVSQ